MIKNGKWVADTTETKYGEVETGLDTIGQEASVQKERAIEVEKAVREEVDLATDQQADTTEEPGKPIEEVLEELVGQKEVEEAPEEPEEETEAVPEEPEILDKSTYEQTDGPTESNDQLTSGD